MKARITFVFRFETQVEHALCLVSALSLPPHCWLYLTLLFRGARFVSPADGLRVLMQASMLSSLSKAEFQQTVKVLYERRPVALRSNRAMIS